MLARHKLEQSLQCHRIPVVKQAHPKGIDVLTGGSPLLHFIWGTYFEARTDIALEDRLDHFTQIGTPFLTQFQSSLPNNPNPAPHGLPSKESDLLRLQAQNKQLRTQLMLAKQQKNRCEQRVIQLSNKLYDIERGLICNMQCEFPQQEEGNTTLDQFSAISIDHDDPKGLLFSKRQSFNLEFNDCDARSEDNDIGELAELHLNFPPSNRHPLKQSLQIAPNEAWIENEGQRQFIQEMKRMKLQTQRIMKMQNNQICLKEGKRRTFGGMTHRPSPVNTAHPDKQNRRFRRIRA